MSRVAEVYSKHILIALVLVLLVVFSIMVSIPRAEAQKIYVAIIWHYHQPWYYSSDETYFILPWVRMHGVGNYYKMAYILSKYPDIKVTFTFSGSLLYQLVDYVKNGKMDLRQIISWKVVNGTLSKDDVFEMLKIPGGFFDINWARIVERSPRFKELRDLAQSLHRSCLAIAKTAEEYKDCVVTEFTGGNLLNQTVIDLAVLFNLLWIDPQVAKEEYPEIYNLMQRAYTERYPNFKREDLELVLRTHVEILSRIVPAYRQLIERGQIEVIPVPYAHPIAPLLVDFGFEEDLEVHVARSFELFRELFNYTPVGVWPAEQAVNEPAVRAFKKAGALWTVTDSTVLAQTGANTQSIEDLGVPWYVDFPEGRMYIFFRETEISNSISFKYNTWTADSAVNDLVNRILNYAKQAKGPRIVVIALDGENPWEHYAEFGTLFLNKLYSKLVELQQQGLIETITPKEFIERFANVSKPLPTRDYLYFDLAGKDISDIPAGSYGDAYGDLPRRTVMARVPEGSWAGNLAIWIGQRQENIAWMWLVKARSDILEKLKLQSFKEFYSRYPQIAEYIMRAQASDWFWWYGGDGGGSAAPFDPLFKGYLKKAYVLTGLEPPAYLNVYAYPDGTPHGVINSVPPSVLDAQFKVDGVIEDLWITAAREGKALELPVGNVVKEAYVVVTRSTIYLAFQVHTEDLRNVKIAVYFATPSASMSPYSPGYAVYPRNSTVDLAIHLARELLLDFSENKATISKFINGTWKSTGIARFAVAGSPGNYSVEVEANITALGLAQGQYTYFAIAVYAGGSLVEWSSRLDLTYQLYIPMLPPELVGRVVLDVEDPVGDDDGAGGFEYPTNRVFVKGVFDLTRFTVVDMGDRIAMKFYFVTLGGNPWGGPNGWSMQQIHVYIRTTLPDLGKREAIGLNVIIENGWHMALLVGPGWGSDALPVGERTGLYYYDKEQPVVQNGDLKAYADPADNAIVVEVSKKLLYDVENINNWEFVVAVTSHDGYGPNRIRPFATAKGEWVIYVPPDYAVAILRNVLPYILDLLAPTKEEQYSMLRSFNAEAGELAKIHGIRITVPTTSPLTLTTPATAPMPTTTLVTTPVPEVMPLPTSTTVITTPATTVQTSPGQPAAGLEYYIAIAIAVIAVVAVLAVVLVMKRRA